MEQLYLNLSEEEFTKDRKIMLWGLASFFFFGSLYVLIASPVFGHKNIPPILAIAPFTICFGIVFFGVLDLIKRKDLFFLIDYGKIEFRFGILKPKRRSFKWTKILSLEMPLNQRKIKLNLVDGSSFVINLIMLKRSKSTAIKQYIYTLATEKGIKITIVKALH